jgi:hypothetical protein
MKVSQGVNVRTFSSKYVFRYIGVQVRTISVPIFREPPYFCFDVFEVVYEGWLQDEAKYT